MTREYFHFTWKKLLPSILKHGLLPSERTGDSAYEGRTVKRIYLLEPEDVDEGGWFYGNVLLRVRIPKGVTVKRTVFAEGVYVTKPIPPSHISIQEARDE